MTDYETRSHPCGRMSLARKLYPPAAPTSVELLPKISSHGAAVPSCVSAREHDREQRDSPRPESDTVSHAPSRCSKAPKRVILYARSANENQRNPGGRVEEQFRLLRSYALARGYFVVDEECDVGQSGNSPARPGLTLVMRRLRQRPRAVDLILTRDPSRLARNVGILQQIAGQVADAGVGIEYVDGQHLELPVLTDWVSPFWPNRKRRRNERPLDGGEVS